MSESTNTGSPALAEEVQELQAHFPNDATLQDALGRLTLLGFDRADLSVPDEKPSEKIKETPDDADAAPSDIDNQQVRTMASGITGTATGMGVAAILGTGGLAAPVVAAVAGLSAIGVVAATTTVGVAADKAGTDERDRRGARGTLILAVRTRDPAKNQDAVTAMRDAGATHVAAITRAEDAVTRGLPATSWTG